MGFVIQVPCRTEAKAQNLGAQLRACCRRMEGRGGKQSTCRSGCEMLCQLQG